MSKVSSAPKARTPQKIGAVTKDGIYLGAFFLVDKPYRLFAAPRKQGELESMQWLAKYDEVPGATSSFDGLANTQAMAKAGSDLAKKMLALRIGGHDDWYLMSRGEALIAEAAGIKGAEAFPKKWHWTSSQLRGYRYYAYVQYFDDGDQYYYFKDSRFFARAVRRKPIE